MDQTERSWKPGTGNCRKWCDDGSVPCFEDCGLPSTDFVFQQPRAFPSLVFLQRMEGNESGGVAKSNEHDMRSVPENVASGAIPIPLGLAETWGFFQSLNPNRKRGSDCGLPSDRLVSGRLCSSFAGIFGSLPTFCLGLCLIGLRSGHYRRLPWFQPLRYFNRFSL
jgi:hypothetical protein